MSKFLLKRKTKGLVDQSVENGKVIFMFFFFKYSFTAITFFNGAIVKRMQPWNEMEPIVSLCVVERAI